MSVRNQQYHYHDNHSTSASSLLMFNNPHSSSLLNDATAIIQSAVVCLVQKLCAAFLHSPTTFVIGGLWIYFVGTFLFDAVHYLLHCASKSRYRALRMIGDVHLVHHLYFNRKLKFNDRYHWHNILVEIPLELVCQVIGSWMGWKVINPYLGSKYNTFLEANPHALLTLINIIQICRVLVVLAEGGHDSNHVSYRTIPDDPNLLIVGPEYHALHHSFPDRYMSSAVRIFDWFFGLSSNLKSKRVALTGANGAYGGAIKKKLLADGVSSIVDLKYGKDWTHDNFEAAIPILANSDVLILAHGSKGPDAIQANTTSSITLISLFLTHRIPRPAFDMAIPEVWYTGSEIELHPAWGIPELQRYSASKRNFLPFAKALYEDPKVLYRHVVLASFQSPMGSAIVSADWAAYWTMWWVRRGAKYIPVTYTGMAVMNYFKFAWFVKASSLEGIERSVDISILNEEGKKKKS